jgi:hypothetical protein
MPKIIQIDHGIVLDEDGNLFSLEGTVAGLEEGNIKLRPLTIEVLPKPSQNK